MNTSRRRAMRMGLYATASLVALHAGRGLSHAAQKRVATLVEDDSGWLRRDLFERCLGEWFVVGTPAGSMSMKLVRVDDAPTARRDGTVGSEYNFVTVFKGPSYGRLRQGTYPVQSRMLGSFDLFIVPGLSTASGTVYTATFNRLA